MGGRVKRAVVAAGAALAVLASSVAVVAAAGPNSLSSGRVSPTSGTTSTAFTFSVEYRSEKGFAASSVVAVVAGRSLTLRLSGGNASAGTFRGTSTLPAGRWPVSFQAQASQGPSPSVAGPTLVVTAPAPTPPPATPKPPPPPPPPPPVPATVAPAPRASTPAVTPRAQPSAAASTPAPTRPAGATASPTSAAAAPGASTTPTASQDSESPSPTSGVVGGATGGTSPDGSGGDPTGMLLGLGALTVAALGSGAFVIARRRVEMEEAPPVASEPIPLVTVVPRRVPAGSQVEDPILLAMGLGASPPDPNAPITRSVRSGPGERPAPPKFRAH